MYIVYLDYLVNWMASQVAGDVLSYSKGRQ